MTFFVKTLTLSLAALILSSCVSVDKRRWDGDPPERVAILPVFNNSVEVDAQEVLYKYLFEAFSRRGYYVIPPVVMFEMLKEKKGFHEPEMIKAMKDCEIGEFLHADTLLYVTILQWNTRPNLALGATLTVEAEFKMVDAESGTVIFRTTERAVSASQQSRDGGGLSNVLSGVLHAAVASYEPLAKEVVSGAASKTPPVDVYTVVTGEREKSRSDKNSN